MKIYKYYIYKEWDFCCQVVWGVLQLLCFQGLAALTSKTRLTTDLLVNRTREDLYDHLPMSISYHREPGAVKRQKVPSGAIGCHLFGIFTFPEPSSLQRGPVKPPDAPFGISHDLHDLWPAPEAQIRAKFIMTGSKGAVWGCV